MCFTKFPEGLEFHTSYRFWQVNVIEAGLCDSNRISTCKFRVRLINIQFQRLQRPFFRAYVHYVHFVSKFVNMFNHTKLTRIFTAVTKLYGNKHMKFKPYTNRTFEVIGVKTKRPALWPAWCSEIEHSNAGLVFHLYSTWWQVNVTKVSRSRRWFYRIGSYVHVE